MVVGTGKIPLFAVTVWLAYLTASPWTKPQCSAVHSIIASNAPTWNRVGTKSWTTTYSVAGLSLLDGRKLFFFVEQVDIIDKTQSFVSIIHPSPVMIRLFRSTEINKICPL